MKTKLTLALATFTVACFAGAVTAFGQSATIKRNSYHVQTGASTLGTPTTLDPFSFEFHLRGGTINMSQWGPRFYLPGSGGVPATGANADTNTGTSNFSAAPNNGTDYMFIHTFDDAATLLAAYPVGQYGVNFVGSAPPSPSTYTAGLEFATGGFSSTIPQVVAADNDAQWSVGDLRIKPTGVTRISLNAFPEYASATHGALISAGVFDSKGNTIASTSVGSYRAPSLGVNQAAADELVINGAELQVGATYTLQIQYGIFSAAPANGSLNGTNFLGSAGYFRITRVSVSVISEVPHDFNEDGNTDLLWRRKSTGEVAAWFMNGTTFSGSASLGTVPQVWRNAGSGDFNGDAFTDILYRNRNTGELVVWLMNRSTVAGSVSFGQVDLAWRNCGTGDFNRDGKTDILWRNSTTGEVSVWFLDGWTVTGSASIGSVSLEWDNVGTGDFNHDGRTDLLWRDRTNGQVAVWFMDGVQFAGSVSFGIVSLYWDSAGTGDFNYDGHTDLLWRNFETGEVAVWIMDRSQFAWSASMGVVSLEWDTAN